MSAHRYSSDRGEPVSSSSLHWFDSEANFLSLQNSIDARLRELEIKETLVNDRLRDLESREASLDPAPSHGEKLASLLCELDRVCDSVRGVLDASEDPGGLVLEAVGETVGKMSSVVLLEQLVSGGAPNVGPAVRAEAARLAREWRVGIRGHGAGVSEVLGFLLLLGGYDLVDEFDRDEVSTVFRQIVGRDRKDGGGDSGGVEVGWGDHDSDFDGTTPVSQEKTKPSLEDELEFVNQIASAFNCTFEALKSLCVGMDSKNLKLFLYQYMEEDDSWSTEVRNALCHAPDPAKLVLEALPGFLRTQPEFHKKLTIAKVRKISILLMEQLLVITPPISPIVRDEALKLSNEWGSNLGKVYQRPVTVYRYLLFLAAYRLESSFDTDHLLRLLGIASQYKAFPGLCQALGLTDKAGVLIQSLIQKTMLLEAVDNIYAYGLVDKFQPVRQLRGYLTYSKKRIYKQSGQSSSQQKQAINKEIAAIKSVMNYIAKYKLEAKFSPWELEKQILQLEKKKGELNDDTESEKPKVDQTKKVPITKDELNNTRKFRKSKQQKDGKKMDVPCASNTVDSQVGFEPPPTEDSQSDDRVVKPEPSPKEELKLDNEVVKSGQSPTEELQLDKGVVQTEQSPKVASHLGNQESATPNSPWPKLESFCVNMYGIGRNLFSHNKHKNELDSVVSASSPWPELKTFCVNMDGKSLRTFVYEHMDENESFGSEVRDALKCSSDPAKLVLDSMPGCLRSHPEFDESLNMKKVRNSRILLLEQLIAISPTQMSPVVKEEALRLANEWKANLGFKFKGADNVYGFLHFIAAYGLMSNFEDLELLDLLVPANQHKACPDLCRVLGFTDKALVIIEALIQSSLRIEAVEHIHSFRLVNKFSPVLLLNDYMNSKKLNMGETSSPSKMAIETEIAAVRSVIKCVAKYKLESELSPVELKIRIAVLEMQKASVSNATK